MWVKTRQEVELGIILSSLTHTLLVIHPQEAKAVVDVTGEESDITNAPAVAVPYLPRITELLNESGITLPVRLVFTRNHNDLAVKVEENQPALL